MPFFEGEPPKPRPHRRRRLRRDDEYNRPALFVPAYLPADVVLGLSDEAAIVMHGIACYPRGFAFSLEATTRYEVDYEDEDDNDRHGPFGLWGRAKEGAARFGIEYSDGRRAMFDSDRPSRSRNKTDIAIWPGGGSSGGGHSTMDMWVQPLPPPGPVTFAIEWSAKGIDETLHAIDGQEFLDASGRATRVFPPRRS